MSRGVWSESFRLRRDEAPRRDKSPGDHVIKYIELLDVPLINGNLVMHFSFASIPLFTIISRRPPAEGVLRARLISSGSFMRRPLSAGKSSAASFAVFQPRAIPPVVPAASQGLSCP